MLKTHQANTLFVYLTGLANLYDAFLFQKLIAENPWRNPLIAIPGGQRQPTRPTPRMPTHSVRALLLACSAPRDAAILACLFGGGLRRQEVVNLKVGDVQVANGYAFLRLYKTKTQTYAEQSLPAWAGAALEAWHGSARVNGATEDDSLFNLSLEGVHKAWKRMLKQANVDTRYGIHSARCTAINRLRELGYRPEDIADFSRHISVKSVLGYLRCQVPEHNPGRQLSYDE